MLAGSNGMQAPTDKRITPVMVLLIKFNIDLYIYNSAVATQVSVKYAPLVVALAVLDAKKEPTEL